MKGHQVYGSIYKTNLYRSTLGVEGWRVACEPLVTCRGQYIKLSVLPQLSGWTSDIRVDGCLRRERDFKKIDKYSLTRNGTLQSVLLNNKYILSLYNRFQNVRKSQACVNTIALLQEEIHFKNALFCFNLFL